MLLVAVAACGSLVPARLLAQRDTSPFLETSLLSGAAMGGLGAVLNRSPGEGWPRALARGAVAGAAGGWLQYQGKRQVLKMSTRDRLEYAWWARTLHAAGTSIIENAAASRPALESFRFNAGFVRLDLDTRTRTVRARLLPVALYGAVHIASYGRLDARRSLRTGVLTFRARPASDRVRGLAVTRVNTVLYRPDLPDDFISETLAHELVHTLQYDDFAGTTLFARPVATEIGAEWAFGRALGRWIYPDLHAGIDALQYEILNGGVSSCANALEREAYTLSARWAWC